MKTFILVFVLVVSIYSQSALAQDTATVSMAGWTQAGYEASERPNLDFNQDFYLGLARLNARGVHERWGQAFIQFGGESGTPQLLDAMAELKPVEQLSLRMGQFKVPTSADFLIPAPSTGFVNRGLLVGMVQKRRLGGELEGRIGDGPTNGKIRVGWFLPTPDVRPLLPDAKGSFLSAAAQLKFNSAFLVHAAFLTLIATDRDELPAVRPIPYDRQVDLAIVYSDHGWTIHLENLINFEGPTEDEGVTYGGFVHVLKNLPFGDLGHSVEPTFRYDVLIPIEDRLDHRVTVGLNYYIFGDYLNATTNYEFLVEDDEIGHAAYLQFQAGFSKTITPEPKEE